MLVELEQAEIELAEIEPVVEREIEQVVKQEVEQAVE